MAPEFEPSRIEGVRIVRFKAHGDARGRFMETFRKEWFPERSWETLQTNRSDSVAGVLRGLHYHFKQVDYWLVPRGTLRMGLADLRPSSPTHGVSDVIEIGDNNQVGVFVPIGVAHGFYAVTDVTLTYLVDNYYDGADELGVAWNDPDLAVPWGITDPILSGRDEKNLPWREIDPSLLPK